jgi:hypothetical protein
VSAKRLIQERLSKAAPLLLLTLYGAALVTAWALLGLPEPGLLGLAFLYVLSMWIAAGGITLWIYLALSQESSSALLAAAARSSASAVWLVPGALLLASHSQLSVAAGLVAIIGSTGMLAARLVPRGVTIRKRRRRLGQTEPLLFRYTSESRAYVRRQAGPAFLGALALQTGIYGLSGEYPLLAAASFAAATAIWTAMSVARGATKRAAATTRTPYAGPRMVLTLLMAVTLTAALVRKDFPQEDPGTAQIAGIPSMTQSLLQRLAHLPPVLAASPGAARASKKEVVTRLVSAEAENGVPGVIMRPRLQPAPRLPSIGSRTGSRIAPAEPFALPFTGEYHLFRANSGGLPRDAVVETGTPLEHVYVMNSGASMETLAVQTFSPPIDLSLCGRISVALMQLVAEGSVEDGGTELMGMTRERRQVLEFSVPITRRPLLVHAIRISFRHPGPDHDKNVQLAVERLTLVPR